MTTKDIILKEAVTVFANEGYHEAKLARIILNSNISNATFYNTFDGKLDLLLEIFLSYWSDLNQKITERVSKKDDPRQKIDKIYETIIELLLNDNFTVARGKVLIEKIPQKSQMRNEKQAVIEKRDKVFEEKSKFSTTLTDILKQGQKKGLFRKDIKPGLLRNTLSGAVGMINYGLFLNMYTNKEIDYTINEAKKSLKTLIHSFICLNP